MEDSGIRSRRRGRPRKSAQGDTRAAITRAAAAEFAEKGYDAATMRGIAGRAGVDSALVYHYFDTKAALFSAAVEIPVRPDRILGAAFTAPTDRLGAAIVCAVTTAWETPAIRPMATAVVRSALGGTARGRPVREFLMRELVGALAARLEREPGVDAAEAAVRADLALSQVAGMLVMRYLIRLEPLASLEVDEVVARLGPSVQAHIDGVRAAGVTGAGAGAAHPGIDSGGTRAFNSSHDE